MMSLSASIRGPSPSEERSAAACLCGRRSSSTRVGWRSSCSPANGTSASNSTPRAARTRIGAAWLTACSSRAVLPIPGSPRISRRELVPSHRLGLYKAMAESGPITSAELAEKTGTAERYVREWLNAQAAGGFVEYTPETQRYLLPPEQAMALANEESPAFVCGAFELATASLKSESQIESAFRSGAGFGWHQHDLGVSTGCE